MQLVAVVLNWNGGEDTIAALESLDGIETICVDNGSTDGSDAAVEERFPQVELIRTGANLGFAGGNNVGLRRAFERGAEWALLMNNDAMAEPGLADALARAAAARPDAGLLACKILFEDGRTIQYAGATFDARLGYSGRLTGYGTRGPATTTACVTSAGRTERRSRCRGLPFERVGGLDESLFMYVEDVELSLRVRRAGFGVVLVPAARVRHKGSAASGGPCLDGEPLLLGAQHDRGQRALRTASARRCVRFAARSSSARISCRRCRIPRARRRTCRGRRLAGGARRAQRAALTPTYDRSMPRRALITGIGGQDGSLLAELLLDEGYEVAGVARKSALRTRIWRRSRIASS